MEIVNGIDYLDQVKEKIIEYSKWLNRDLSFQNIEEELADPAKKYTPPQGELLVAQQDGVVYGIVAYHRHSQTRCEMKRLYVSEQARGQHLGNLLVEAIMDHAKKAGYKEMVLDTIEPLQAATHIYIKHGFEQCPPYYFNPMDDVLYFKKVL